MVLCGSEFVYRLVHSNYVDCIYCVIYNGFNLSKNIGVLDAKKIVIRRIIQFSYEKSNNEISYGSEK